MTGKQIEVALPKSMYPGFAGTWKATCQRPIYLQSEDENGDKNVCMRITFTNYTGDKSKLNDEDFECLSSKSDLYIDVPMSPVKGDLTKHILGSTNLRGLLKSTYPSANHLHEFATQSVKSTGKYPVSSIVRTQAEEQAGDTPEEEFFTFDPPKMKKGSENPAATGNKILKKPGPCIKSSASKGV